MRKALLVRQRLFLCLPVCDQPPLNKCQTTDATMKKTNSPTTLILSSMASSTPIKSNATRKPICDRL